MNKIVTLTMNPSLDKSIPIKTVNANIKLRAKHLKQDPGGGGLNVSRAIHKLGGKSTALFISGGCTGDSLCQSIKTEGLDFKTVPISDPVRESLTVMEDSTGNQYRFSLPSPRLSSKELDQIEALLKQQLGPDTWLIASGSLPEGVPVEFYARIAAMAHSLGSRTIIDSSGAALQAAVESGNLFLVKPNLRELSHLSGKEHLDDQQIQNESLELVNSGKAEHIVVSLGGSGGAYLINKKEIVQYTQPQVKTDSRIGAGDSMVAGIVYGLTTGYSIKDAVRLGIASGAAAVITPGTELCRPSDVEHLYSLIQEQ